MQELLKIKEKTVCQEVDNEMVIVPLSDDVANMKNIYTLNEVGAFIWQNIENFENQSDIEEAVMANFDAGKETVAIDVPAFLDDLKKTFSFLI